MKIKAETIIWFLIVFLISMFLVYLGYLIYLTVFYNKKTVEGYDGNEDVNQKFNRLQGIRNICNPEDADYNSPGCVSAKFYDYDDSVRSVKVILDPGYGVDPDTGFIKKINDIKTKGPKITLPPNDMFNRHYENSDNSTPFPKPSIGGLNSLGKDELLGNDELSRLDSDNQYIQYHADPAKLPNAKDDLIGYNIIQVDKDGNIDSVPFSKLKGKTLYNQPGNSRFGPSSYVPNYEETVYLSKLTNDTYFEKIPLEDSGSLGFCQNKSLDDIEQKCNSLDNQTCASTECCVLFGGAKCVAGNSRGPSKQSNYNDFLVKNRDYYYYKGKCYGNCSRSTGILNPTPEKTTIGIGISQAYTTPGISQAYTTPGISKAYTTPGISKAYTTPGISQAYTTPSYSDFSEVKQDNENISDYLKQTSSNIAIGIIKDIIYQ